MPWGLEIFYRRDPAGFVDVHSLDGVSTGQLAMVVQPTFLYELLWNLLVFVVLICLDRRFRLGHGRLFAVYVARLLRRPVLGRADARRHGHAYRRHPDQLLHLDVRLHRRGGVSDPGAQGPRGSGNAQRLGRRVAGARLDGATTPTTLRPRWRRAETPDGGRRSHRDRPHEQDEVPAVEDAAMPMPKPSRRRRMLPRWTPPEVEVERARRSPETPRGGVRGRGRDRRGRRADVRPADDDRSRPRGQLSDADGADARAPRRRRCDANVERRGPDAPTQTCPTRREEAGPGLMSSPAAARRRPACWALVSAPSVRSARSGRAGGRRARLHRPGRPAQAGLDLSATARSGCSPG